MMEITELRDGRTLVMTPQGRLDALSTPDFQERMLRCIEAGERSLLLDFSLLDYISSSGLRAVLIAAKRLNERDGRLAVCALHDTVREIFRISGFDSIIATHPDRDTALAQLA